VGKSRGGVEVIDFARATMIKGAGKKNKKMFG